MAENGRDTTETGGAFLMIIKLRKKSTILALKGFIRRRHLRMVLRESTHGDRKFKRQSFYHWVENTSKVFVLTRLPETFLMNRIL